MSEHRDFAPHVAGMPGDFAVQGGAHVGFWNHTLAFWHANPAHSALRRARHFRNAERILWLRGAAFGDDGRFFLEQWATQSAQVEQMWSVR